MPLSQPVLEGATPWFRNFFTTNLPCWPSSGSSSCCISAGRGEARPRPPRQRSTKPKTFEGLTHPPYCAWCEQDTGETNPAPPVQPDPMPSTNRRPRTVDTSMHFCPHTACDVAILYRTHGDTSNRYP